MTDARLIPSHIAMPPGRAADWRALVLAATDTPCQSAPSWWTSDEPEFQDLAAAACLDCPVLALCQDYGLAHPDERGVYGGLTEDARRPRRNRQRKEAS